MNSKLDNISLILIILSTLIVISILYLLIARKNFINQNLSAIFLCVFILVAGWSFWFKKRIELNEIATKYCKTITLENYKDNLNSSLILKCDFSFQIVSQKNQVVQKGNWDLFERETNVILVDGELLGTGDFKLTE